MKKTLTFNTPCQLKAMEGGKIRLPFAVCIPPFPQGDGFSFHVGIKFAKSYFSLALSLSLFT